jgi:CDP-glycerol glycerophosphotransferase
MAPMTDTLAPAADTLAALDARLAGVEAFNTQVSQAIESLVSSVVEKSQELATLQVRLRETEQQLNLERSVRDLERTSRLHPKERCVVFVGTVYLGDNVKYAWLAFRERARAVGIACWFLPQDEHQEQLVRGLGDACFPHRYADWDAEHLHAALAAAVVVTSDHFMNPNPYAAALLAGARHVQLWHGVSIKEIGLRNLAPLKHMSPRYARVLATCGPYASFVGTAANAEGEWRRWFGFERYAALGYARNDVLHREPTEGDLLNVDRTAWQRARDTRAAGGRVILYAPTFRDANRAKWLVEAGVGRVVRELARRGDCLLVNLHPVEQPHAAELAQAMPGVNFVTPRTDLYPLLRESDALVTDYSSVMFDYLHLDRPIVLFRPDHRDYTEKSRKLFDAKLAVPPGPVAADAQALLSLLAKKDLGAAAHAEARHTLRASLYDDHDGRSGERLADLILDELARAGAA